jgi:hypothetical protein
MSDELYQDILFLDSVPGITIQIDEEVHTFQEMADLLRHIADDIEKRGVSSGYCPNWQLNGDVHGARRKWEESENLPTLEELEKGDKDE